VFSKFRFDFRQQLVRALGFRQQFVDLGLGSENGERKKKS
jgi:hypothetical protein